MFLHGPAHIEVHGEHKKHDSSFSPAASSPEFRAQLLEWRAEALAPVRGERTRGRCRAATREQAPAPRVKARARHVEEGIDDGIAGHVHVVCPRSLSQDARRAVSVRTTRRRPPGRQSVDWPPRGMAAEGWPMCRIRPPRARTPRRVDATIADTKTVVVSPWARIQSGSTSGTAGSSDANSCAVSCDGRGCAASA